ncbi:MAG: HD-GYP domain-containing protein, partial [Thiohalomonadales bacterium]
ASCIKPMKPYTSSFENEYPHAKKTYEVARESITRIFGDARVGKSLDVEKTRQTVGNLVESVMRHPDALMLMTTMQDKSKQAVAHAINVCAMSVTFGRSLGFDERQLSELGIGALLHDIGQIKLDQELLENFSNCSETQLKHFQDHTSYGSAILHNTEGLPASATSIARDHHERSNGTGYPQKLLGNEVDLFTKVVSIVDIYDNVTSGMHGLPSIPCTEALKNMYTWRKNLFDPLLVEKFIQCLGIYPIGSVVELTSGDIGIVISLNPDLRLLPTVMLVKNSQKQTIETPKLINLSLFMRDASEQKKKIEIRRVLKTEENDIDVRSYILRELPPLSL